jgi:murein DD-endopeptidase MepM/ murein hydrolase activator NlpD
VEHQDSTAPAPVVFPLPAGEWYAPNTPGHRVPSHGTDQLGQRYAYDFVHAADWELGNSFRGGMRYFFGGGISLKRSRGMNAPILAPIGGTVIAAKDGWPERKRATPIDILAALTAGMRLSEPKLRADYRIVAGNYIIIAGQQGFAFLAHATTGSICVAEGQQVRAGEPVARVGDTGNSTAPHLHYHLMDGPDLWTAKGLPSCFTAYERLVDGEWRRVENGVPGRADRLRSC